MSRILITGASKGIGRALAVELIARGHDVVATARQPEALADLSAAQALRLDVTDQRSVDDAVEQAGPVDVVVNNAGEIVVGSVEDTPVAELERLLEINTIGAIRVAAAVVPQMRERRAGQIVFMSSIAGRVALPLIGPYAATKWALEVLGETLAMEVSGFGITVNLLEPGTVDSGALSAPTTYSGAGHYAELAAATSLDAGMMPVEDVATAAADVIDARDTRLRIPIGALASSLLGANGPA